jgi:hypothetical protein
VKSVVIVERKCDQMAAEKCAMDFNFIFREGSLRKGQRDATDTVGSWGLRAGGARDRDQGGRARTSILVRIASFAILW